MKRFIYWLRVVYVNEFRIIIHDPGIILFLVFLPLVYPVVYSLIYNPELVRDVKMVVVDHDRTASSRELVRNLDATQEIYVIGYATDLADGRRAMDSHKCYGILEIPQGFGKSLGRGEVGNAVIYSDMSLLLRYRGFLMASTNVAQEMGAKLQAAKIGSIVPAAGSYGAGDPMPVENIPLGNIESGFDSFVMPGVLILILQQCIVLAVGMAGGAKREAPWRIGYNPHNMAPSIFTTLLGQSLCFMTVMVIPIFILVHYVPLVFAFPMAGSVWQILLFVLPLVLSSLMLGFCIQGVVWERESVFVIWVVTSVMFLFLSGLTWPRYAMAPVWKFLSDIVPATWGVEGFIRMNTNGSTLAQVSTDYINLWILTGVYALLAYAIQRWVVRPSEYRAYTPPS